MTAALLLMVGLAVGWVARDLWQAAADLFEIYRDDDGP
jgi:hypothetical protein